MNKDFVRGGQLSLHSLRMLKQVFVAVLRWGIVLMCCISLIYTASRVSLYDFKVTYWYLVAEFFVDMNSKEHVLLIEDLSGQKMEISANALVLSSKMAKTKNYVFNTFNKSLKVGGLYSIIFLALVALIFIYSGRKFGRDREVRGSSLISSSELKKLITKDNKKERCKSYTIGNIPYPAYSETTHTLIAGSTGSGKTILISELIAQIKKNGDRAIIYDKMGVYTERFFDSKHDVLLNPFDQRSPNWSIFKEVKQEANFDAIASALIPFEKSTADPFWTKAARTLFSEVCSSLLKKGGISNSELVNTLLKKDLKEAASLVKGTAAQAIIDEQSPKTALSVMSILATYLKCLKFLKDEGELFSIKDWINNEDQKGCIFTSSTGDLHPTLTPLISAWIEVAITNILSLPRSRNRKIWIILDELPSLHTLPSLEQGLAETRQFGGCFVLSIQSISQLRDRYGMNNSQTISSLCNNKIFLRAGDFDSARWYADNIGANEVEEYKESLSYGAHEMRDGVSINKHKHNRNLTLPSELINLKDKEGYFCMAKGYPIAKVIFEYKDWPQLNIKLDAYQNLQSQTIFSTLPEIIEDETTDSDENNSTDSVEENVSNINSEPMTSNSVKENKSVFEV